MSNNSRKIVKIVLVYPPKVNQAPSQTPNFVHQDAVVYPPLGLLYLAGMFRDDPNVEVKVIDCQIDFEGVSSFAATVRREKPDILGITLISNLLFDAYALLKATREAVPDTCVVAGGPHASLFPEEVLRSGFVDFVMSGDAEVGFKKLVGALVNSSFQPRGNFSDIPGLIYKNDQDEIRRNPNTFHENVDFDHLPFPDRTLLDSKAYGNPGNRSCRVTSLVTSRGCPFRCIFCDVPHKKYISRSASNVVDEIEEILNLGIDEINILDDTFNINRQRVVEICDEILRRGLNFRWIGRGRVHPFDDELARLLRRAGCVRFHVGVESSSDEMLERIGKGITVQQVMDFFAICRRNKLETLAYFIIGFPEETEEHMEQTIRLALDLKPTYVYFSILSLFPGSRIYKSALENRLLDGDPWLSFSLNPTIDFEVPFWPGKVGKERLYEILRQAYKRFYFSPAYLAGRALGMLTSFRGTVGAVRTAAGMLRYIMSEKKGFG